MNTLRFCRTILNYAPKGFNYLIFFEIEMMKQMQINFFVLLLIYYRSNLKINIPIKSIADFHITVIKVCRYNNYK